MQKQIKSKGDRSAMLLIDLCWLVYTCSYIGKVNYSANINPVMRYYSISHAEAGLVGTMFFFAYGIGQVFNGIYCKKYNLKWIIFISLITSGTINLIIPHLTTFAPIKYLWVINGFALSILWPSLIRLLAETLSREYMARASVIMGTTVAIGTFFVYGTSALFVSFATFRWAFNIAAIILILVAFIWIMLISRLKNAESNKEMVSRDEGETTANIKKSNIKGSLYLSICMLAFYGIVTNLVKDGLTTWVPSILKENYGLDDSLSIILTLTLPVVAIFGNALAVFIHKKINDFVCQCALMFLISAIIIGFVIGALKLNQFIITLIGFSMVCLLVSSCNSLITSIFPLFMKGKVNSGRIAGILNGFCYVGSTLSSYGLGKVADSFDWSVVFWVLFSVCSIACVVALVYIFIKAYISKRHKKAEK